MLLSFLQPILKAVPEALKFVSRHGAGCRRGGNRTSGPFMAVPVVAHYACIDYVFG